MTQHTYYQKILAEDFNREILLKIIIYKGIPTVPNSSNQKWARVIQSNDLNIIDNLTILTGQRGHNYTSTSHIDGFYTNVPNASNIQSHTITNLNQNSYDYSVKLQLTLNSIVIKEKHNAHKPTLNQIANSPLKPPKSTNNLLWKTKPSNRKPHRNTRTITPHSYKMGRRTN